MSVSKKDAGTLAMEIERLAALRSAAGLPVEARGLANCVCCWEELRSVGFNPRTGALQAVVSINCATGYTLGLSKQANEHIRFFLDIGSGFQDVGCSSFRASEITDSILLEHPFFYSVEVPIPQRLYRQMLSSVISARVRAVLSWNKVPTRNADDLPLFGNRIETEIQLEKKAVANTGAVLSTPLPSSVAGNEQCVIASPAPRNLAQAAQLAQQRRDLPEHRRAFAAVQQFLQSDGNAATQDTATDVTLDQVLSVLGAPKASTEFEELVSVGLNMSTDSVGATVLLKKPHGYTEGPRVPGWEHVAFWADCNNDGVFEEYLGMASVEVREGSAALPHRGFSYSVAVPIPNSIRSLKSRGIFKSVRLRAVLSWAVPPSASDPEMLGTWGNRLEAQVYLGGSGSAKDERHRADPDFLAWLAKLRPSATRSAVLKESERAENLVAQSAADGGQESLRKAGDSADSAAHLKARQKATGV